MTPSNPKKKSKNQFSNELRLKTKKNVKTPQISKEKFSKKLKNSKLPDETPNNKKSKECSSKLMLKTKKFHTYLISKQQY